MPAAVRYQNDQAILRTLTAWPLYQKSDSIFVFVSVKDEVNTYPIIADALEAGKKVYVPFLPEGTKEMLAVPLDRLSSLVPGAFGIPTAGEAQVATNAKAQAPRHIDLCLVPGLLFDTKGYRIGYGGGYYDRFLSSHPDSLCVGLCYSLQLSSSPLPKEEWDRPLAYLLHENGLFTIG